MYTQKINPHVVGRTYRRPVKKTADDQRCRRTYFKEQVRSAPPQIIQDITVFGLPRWAL